MDQPTQQMNPDPTPSLSEVHLVPDSEHLRHDNLRDIVIQDHRHIISCYEMYLVAPDFQRKKEFINQFIRAICIHSGCEELGLYPHLEKHLPQLKGIVQHSLDEHQQLKKDLRKLDNMHLNDADFAPTLQKIIEELKHHMEEEEAKILSQLSQIAPANMKSLVDHWYRNRKLVPTHPHPHAPDRPPMETMVGMMAAPFDKLRDLTREYPQDVKKQHE